jgi:Alpha-mannosidase
LYRYLLCLLVGMTLLCCATAQQVYFIDGYHGGVYGHYPKQYTAYINEMLEKHPHWYINLEIEPETWDTVALHEPDNYRRFKEWIADQSVNGRVEYVNPAYGQPYFYNINGESIIRQFGYGIDKLRRHFPNLEFTTYSSEEPCFTSALPQILKSFGFKYASLKNPNTCWGGYTRNYGGEMINWQGPDGTLLPTVPRYGIEALDKHSTWQTTASTNSKEYLDAAFKAGIKHPVGMCLQDAGWKVGPWLKTAGRHYPTHFTTWRMYMEQIADKKDLPTWRFSHEDVLVSLVWGSQVLQRIARQVRYAENRIVRAEKMAAMANISNKQAFDEAWRQVLLAQHHDCWIVPYNGKKNDKWKDKVQRWTDSSNNIASSIIQTSFAAMRTNRDSANWYVRVANTNADELDGYIRIPLPEGMNGIEDEKGIILPAQVSKNELIAKVAVPGISTRVFKFTRSATVTGSLVSKRADGTWLIETDLYKIVIDPAKGGAITSLIAKKLKNKEFVDGGLTVLEGYFNKDKRYFSSTTNTATIEVLYDGPLSATVQINGSIHQHPFKQVLTIYKDQSLIDVQLTINWKGNPGIGDDYKLRNEDYRKAFYDDKKKLRTLFSLNLDGQKVYKNAPFDVTESRLDNTYYHTWDSIKNNVLLNWIDITDKKGKYGLALFTDHTTAYTHGAGDPLGLVTQYAGAGLWGVHCSIDGSTELHYALLPHAGNWAKAGIWTANVAWNNPPEMDLFKASSHEPACSLLTIRQKGFEITAIEKRGNDLLVRLFNPHPKAKKADLFINGSFREVEEQELDGRVIQKLKRRGNHVVAPMRGFGISTLIIKNYSSHEGKNS